MSSNRGRLYAFVYRHALSQRRHGRMTKSPDFLDRYVWRRTPGREANRGRPIEAP